MIFIHGKKRDALRSERCMLRVASRMTGRQGEETRGRTRWQGEIATGRTYKVRAASAWNNEISENRCESPTTDDIIERRNNTNDNSNKNNNNK